jgi:hypothetical protein
MKLRDIRRRASSAMSSGVVITLRLSAVHAVMLQHTRQPSETMARAMRAYLKEHS